jgi:hypothetical protein
MVRQAGADAADINHPHPGFPDLVSMAQGTLIAQLVCIGATDSGLVGQIEI